MKFVPTYPESGPPERELPAPDTEDMPPWWLDLFLNADGTIRLRDVSGNSYTGAARWEPEKGAKPPKFCPQCGDPFDDGDVAG